MAIFGLQPTAHCGNCPGKHKATGLFGGSIMFLGMLVLLILGGCMQTTSGFPPRIDSIRQLQRGQTKMSDVLLTLGEPRGFGSARLSAAMSPREIWFYEFVKTEGGKTDDRMLLVFFNNGVYDGYLFFSADTILKMSR